MKLQQRKRQFKTIAAEWRKPLLHMCHQQLGSFEYFSTISLSDSDLINWTIQFQFHSMKTSDRKMQTKQKEYNLMWKRLKGGFLSLLEWIETAGDQF